MIAKFIIPFVFGVLVAVGILTIRHPAPTGGESKPHVAEQSSTKAVKANHSLDAAANARGGSIKSTDSSNKLTKRSSDISRLTSEFIKIRRAIMRTKLRNIDLAMQLAEEGTTEIHPEFEEALEERRSLRAASPFRTTFSNGRLGDVFNLLASQAGVSFIVPDNLDMSSLISWDVEESPFATIEAIAHSKGYLLAKDGDDWTLQPVLDDAISGEVDQALARLLRQLSPNGNHTHLFPDGESCGQVSSF